MSARQKASGAKATGYTESSAHNVPAIPMVGSGPGSTPESGPLPQPGGSLPGWFSASASPRVSRQDFERLTRLIRKYLRRRVPEAALEDLTAEIWFRAYARRDSFRGSGSFEHWLIGIARYAAIDWWRGQKLRQERLRELEEAMQPDTESTSAGSPYSEVLHRQHWRRMTERANACDRKVLQVIESVGGADPKSLASALSVTVSSAYRALVRLTEQAHMQFAEE